MTYTIVIVDDDDNIHNLIISHLQEEKNFSTCVLQAFSKQEFLALLNKTIPFDLILLDIQLPDATGFEMIPLCKDQNIHCPIIMLTSRHDEESIIHALTLGASDYIKKPFLIRELILRMQFQLRQYEHLDTATLLFSHYSFLPNENQIKNLKTKKNFKLTDKETQIMRLLYLAKGKTVSKEKILKDIWGYSQVLETHTLETHIYRLRQKLMETNSSSSIILTQTGGYALDIPH